MLSSVDRRTCPIRRKIPSLCGEKQAQSRFGAFRRRFKRDFTDRCSRSLGRSTSAEWKTGDLQHRPGRAVYGRGVYRPSGGGGGAGEHGWCLAFDRIMSPLRGYLFFLTPTSGLRHWLKYAAAPRLHTSNAWPRNRSSIVLCIPMFTENHRPSRPASGSCSCAP